MISKCMQDYNSWDFNSERQSAEWGSSTHFIGFAYSFENGIG